MSSLEAQPNLRLVGAEDPGSAGRRRAREAVARENRAAARSPGLDPTDPRWVLAVRAYRQLQGGALTAEDRREVARTARRLGLRPFEANLIIAIVQDRARRGRDLADAAGAVELLDPPARRSRRAEWARWIAAGACAAAANVLLIWWLGAG